MIKQVLIRALVATHPNPARAFTLAAAELPREAWEKLKRISNALGVTFTPPKQ